MFLYTSRFDIREREAKELKRFFSLNKIKVVKEEKDGRPNDVKIHLISDTKEPDNRSYSLIDVDKA